MRSKSPVKRSVAASGAARNRDSSASRGRDVKSVSMGSVSRSPPRKRSASPRR